MDKFAVSKATLGRLPMYLHHLKSLSQKTEHISATAIAKGLSLGEVQVRKDLSLVSGAGKPKIGYVIHDLIHAIEMHLGYGCQERAVIVGAGRLGRALLEYDGFEDYGVKIAAAFDISESMITKSNNIFPMEEFHAFCKNENIHIGIITTNKQSAQQVCDEMLNSGITAIWNFAPCKLNVPDGILVRQENLALSLAHLNRQNCILK